MYYKKENPHGGQLNKDVLDFSVNLNPLGTPKRVLDAAREAVSFAWKYPDAYCEELIEALSEGERLSVDCFVCGNGAAELIYAYCGGVKPKTVLQLIPTFSEYQEAARAYGAEILDYRLNEESGFMPDEKFAAFLQNVEPEVLFICNPNNPTGRIYPEAFMEEIVYICKERNIKIFVDECFLDLSVGGNHSLKKHLEANPNIFILKAFTKTYAMPGLRLGYGMTSDKELLKKMSEYLQPWNVSVIAQAAGMAALKEDLYVREAIEVIKEEGPILKRELENLGAKVYSSDTSFILFRLDESETAFSIKEKLEEKNILIRDCSNFKGLGKGWYRIGIKTKEENRKLIGAMAEILKP